MSAARTFLVVLGAVFAVAGIVVARLFDPTIGLGVLIVGAFLLILPVIALRSED